MKKPQNIYLKLFLSTLQLSAFTFGGGYVIVPLLRKKFVEKYKWISEGEMLDITAISQASPGAMAVNASILIGYRLAGILGALITVLGTIIPPLITITAISYFYQIFRDSEIVAAIMKGMQSGIAAIIVDVVYKMGIGFFKSRDYVSIGIMVLAFCLTFFLSINIVFIIFGGIIFGVFLYFLRKCVINKNLKNDKNSENNNLNNTTKDGAEDDLS